MITIVDFGAGNLRSVINAFEAIGRSPRVTNDPDDLVAATAIILPGVGAFGDGMDNLRRRELRAALDEQVLRAKKPYLGICLGLQFLAAASEEHGEHEGLGWLGGRVVRIKPESDRFRIPHIGWNDVKPERDDPLFRDLGPAPVFYFVHGFRLALPDAARETVSATCWHGEEIVAAVSRDNIFGVQFHPEKSQRDGLQLLDNFVKRVVEC